MWALGRFNKKNGPTKYGKTRHGVQLTANSWHKGFFEYVQSKTAFKVFNSFHSLIISVYHPHNKLQIQGHKKNEVAQETHKPKNHRKQPVSLSFMDNGIRLNNDRE